MQHGAWITGYSEVNRPEWVTSRLPINPLASFPTIYRTAGDENPRADRCSAFSDSWDQISAASST
jgi:hypothetical protein